MTEIYSHSKLWLYENCPEAYKIKYIDKAWPDIPESVNTFLGKMVHETLEKFYKKIKNEEVAELDEFVKDFAARWHEKFTKELRLNGDDAGKFFEKGVKFLVDYYQSNKPFSEKTIEIEKRITFPLDENNNYFIQGYIDRIVLRENGGYEVHDYKTNDMLKTQKQVDTDRQLAFYHLGLNSLFGDEIKVKLIWHFLAHNKKVQSTRTKEQLESLKKETLQLISKIESTTIWPACGKHWCDWCAYKAKMKWQNNGNHKLDGFMR